VFCGYAKMTIMITSATSKSCGSIHRESKTRVRNGTGQKEIVWEHVVDKSGGGGGGIKIGEASGGKRRGKGSLWTEGCMRLSTRRLVGWIKPSEWEEEKKRGGDQKMLHSF